MKKKILMILNGGLFIGTQYIYIHKEAAERSKRWGGGGRRLGVGMNGGGGVGVFDKEYSS